MIDSRIFDMPMKLSLEFVPSVRPYCVNAEREFFDHVINKVTGVRLVMSAVDLKGSNASGIGNGGVLIPANPMVAFIW